MKTFKGTKEEWSVQIIANGLMVRTNNRTICKGFFRSNQVDQANAKLIASAPQLLEALQDLMEEVYSDIENSDDSLQNTVWKKCKKAINKAL